MNTGILEAWAISLAIAHPSPIALILIFHILAAGGEVVGGVVTSPPAAGLPVEVISAMVQLIPLLMLAGGLLYSMPAYIVM